MYAANAATGSKIFGKESVSAEVEIEVLRVIAPFLISGQMVKVGHQGGRDPDLRQAFVTIAV